MSENENDYFQSKLAIAKAFGVHRHTVDGWERRTWFPKRSKKGYLKSEVVAAVDKWESQRTKGPDAEGGGDKQEKTALECRLLRIRIDKEKELLEQTKEQTRRAIEDGLRQTKKLIDIKEVEAGMNDALGKMRIVIETWAKEQEAEHPELHGVFKRAAENYMEKMLHEFS